MSKGWENLSVIWFFAYEIIFVLAVAILPPHFLQNLFSAIFTDATAALGLLRSLEKKDELLERVNR